MLEQLFSYLRGKSILILGLGAEGRSSLRLLEKYQEQIGYSRLALADQRPQEDLDLEAFYGPNYLEHLTDFDLVLKSPGISLQDLSFERREGLVYLAGSQTEISGQIDLFLRFQQAYCLGVTGTKGKSTTTSMIYQILQKVPGRRAYLAGNIGLPVFEIIEDLTPTSLVALELGAHQLEFCQASPNVAVLTNFYPEHLDHYKSYEAYLATKLNILKWQNKEDLAVLNLSSEQVKNLALPLLQGSLIGAYTDLNSELVENAYCLTKGDNIYLSQTDELYDTSSLNLLGKHNYFNALLAIAATSNLGLSVVEQVKALQDFTGLEHRLEYVGNFAGRRVYNDSIATIPQACLLAVEALASQNLQVLLLGGLDRGLDYQDFVSKLYEFPVRELILLPDTGKIIYELASEYQTKIASAKRKNLHLAANMQEAVNLAYLQSQAGESILLSPAASSYNLYKNFAARGNDFKAEIKRQEGAFQ